MLYRFIAVLAFAAVARAAAPSLPKMDPSHVDVYITPFYSSNGPTVDVGPFSAGLASSNENDFLATIAKMKKQWATLNFPQVYVGSIRLYDMGYRDEAVYWFYTAQYRARVFAGCVDQAKIGSIGSPAFELDSAAGAFHELVGPYLNGYAFGHLDMLLSTLDRVRKEGESLPDLKVVYPNVSFTNNARWTEVNKTVADGLTKLAAYAKENAAELKAKRAERGMDKFDKLASKNLLTDKR